MLRSPARRAASAACLLVLLSACAPTFNWRETPIGTSALLAMFPCKPETVTRTLPLAQAEHAMAMRSCDADGVTFAVAHAVLSDPTRADQVLTDWRASTLAGLRADPATATSEVPKGLPVLPRMQVLRAGTAAGDPKPMQLRGVWFASGADVFAAFVLAPQIPAEASDPFFAGLRLR